MDNHTYILATSKPWHNDLAKDCLHIDDKFIWAHDPDQLDSLLKSAGSIRYIFFLHWNWLVPINIWQRYECVCFHMTDLPYGRGGSPLQNLIVDGCEKTKLTALKMVEEMDAGPVYTKVPLSLQGTAEEIYLRAGELSFSIIDWMIMNQPKPEDQQGAPVIFKRRGPEQSRLPQAGGLKKLYDHIRMLDAPTYPKAFLEYGDYVLEFSKADIGNDKLTASVCIREKNDQEKT
ncbi:hypothetical protein [Salinicola halimionae]|uniref:hypothetical protein n=1 Tax=Salinicola halimionae TaxID=1949081 RepID=UPI001CB72DB8|nr:hypothetical protein [Salinicola halimionae]